MTYKSNYELSYKPCEVCGSAMVTMWDSSIRLLVNGQSVPDIERVLVCGSCKARITELVRAALSPAVMLQGIEATTGSTGYSYSENVINAAAQPSPQVKEREP